jgi:hypothetical protein
LTVVGQWAILNNILELNNCPMKIFIEEYSDGFVVRINDKRFSFNQEDTVEGLVDVFKALGFDDVVYEEVC